MAILGEGNQGRRKGDPQGPANGRNLEQSGGRYSRNRKRGIQRALLDRRFDTSDLVRSSGESDLSVLDPTVSKGESPDAVRAVVFRNELEKIINALDLVPYPAGKIGGTFLTQVVDEQGTARPVLVKVILPDEQGKVAAMEESYRMHVALLGQEFVEDITRVTVANRQVLKQIRDQEGLTQTPAQLEGFVQDLRGINERSDLWTYLIDHHEDMSPAMSEQIRTFLSRVLTATRRGFGFDLSGFPTRRETESNRKARLRDSDVLVDEEGVTFIDTNMITTNPNVPLRQYSLYQLRIATLLLTRQITVEQAFELASYDRAVQELDRITPESIPGEADHLLSLLS